MCYKPTHWPWVQMALPLNSHHIEWLTTQPSTFCNPTVYKDTAHPAILERAPWANNHCYRSAFSKSHALRWLHPHRTDMALLKSLTQQTSPKSFTFGDRLGRAKPTWCRPQCIRWTPSVRLSPLQSGAQCHTQCHWRVDANAHSYAWQPWAGDWVAPWQHAMFTLINHIITHPNQRLVLSADCPPETLACSRDDLRTRLGLALLSICPWWTMHKPIKRLKTHANFRDEAHPQSDCIPHASCPVTQKHSLRPFTDWIKPA